MRTFTLKFAWMMSALLPMLFTSCDTDDEYTAYTLEGTWEGTFFLSSTWDNYTFAISRTQLYFNRDPYYYASGTGYWIDYYSDASWDYVANHIEWQVRDKIIEIYLVEDNYTYIISDYTLNDDRFRGRIYDGDNYLNFDLRHISSPNWYSFDYHPTSWYYEHYGFYHRSNGTSLDGNENTRRSQEADGKTAGKPHRDLAPSDTANK